MLKYLLKIEFIFRTLRDLRNLVSIENGIFDGMDQLQTM